MLPALALAVTLPALGVIHHVGVDGNGFHPATLTITAGDTVIWTNYDEDDFPHSIVSTLPFGHPQFFQGVVVGYSDTYSRTFLVPGTYNYQDTLDAGFGTVIVEAVPPSQAIILSAPRLENGQFVFQATGLTTGRTNIVEISANLIHWSAISTNVATASTATYTNAAAASGRFFRLVERP